MEDLSKAFSIMVLVAGLGAVVGYKVAPKGNLTKAVGMTTGLIVGIVGLPLYLKAVQKYQVTKAVANSSTI